MINHGDENLVFFCLPRVSRGYEAGEYKKKLANPGP